MLKKELIVKFIEMLISQKNLSNNSVEAYKSDLEKFFIFLGDKNISEITSSDIENFIKAQKESGLKPNSVLRKISSLKQFLNFLNEEEVISSNPLNSIISPKKPKNLPKVLSEFELKKLLEVCYEGKNPEDLRLTALLELLYASGVRVSELLSLTLNNLKFFNDSNQAVLIVKGKGGKERLAPINELAYKALIKYMDIRHIFFNIHNQKWLFPSKSSRQGFLTRQRFGQLLKELAQKSGIKESRISPHVIRHSFATHMLNNGIDLLVLQKILGHEDISTTEIYTHVASNDIKQMLEKSHPLALKNI